jgi:SAM-dependent methyltransferase
MNITRQELRRIFTTAVRHPVYAVSTLPKWLDDQLQLSERSKAQNVKCGIAERLIVEDWDAMKLTSDVGNLAHLQRYEWVLPLVRTSRLLLDDGCGSGYGTHYLVANGVGSAIGIDNSRNAIRYASKHYRMPNLTFKVMDGCSLGFEAETFDAIVSFDVIEHIPYANKDRFIAETARVLKQNGTLFIGCPNAVPERDPNPFHYDVDKPMFERLINSHYREMKCLGQHKIRPEDSFDSLRISEDNLDTAFGLLAVCRKSAK